MGEEEEEEEEEEGVGLRSHGQKPPPIFWGNTVTVCVDTGQCDQKSVSERRRGSCFLSALNVFGQGRGGQKAKLETTSGDEEERLNN